MSVSPPRTDETLDLEMLQSRDGTRIAEGILALIKPLLDIWGNLAPSDIQVRRINTAMTNFVYVVTSTLRMSTVSYEDSESTSREPERLLLRVYGKSNWMFQRQQEEAAAMTLAASGLIPRWYGIFGNGRIEDFMPSHPVSAEDFRTPAVYEEVARNLAAIHAMLPKILKETGWEARDYIWDRTRALQRAATDAYARLSKSAQTEGYAEILQRIDRHGLLRDGLLETLRERLERSASPLVFGHCDVHHENLLQLHAGGIMIIDYEYGIPTTRGYDLANLLCEFCSDYNGERPEEVHREHFPSPRTIDDIIAHYSSGRDVETVREEALAYLPLVYLHWGHWGLVKADESHSGSFDYLAYAMQRYQQFIDWTSGNG